MSHFAPPVTYPVCASKTEQALFGVLAVCTAMALLGWAHAWAWHWQRLPAPYWMMLVALAAWVAWWRWRTRHPLEGRLAWEPPDKNVDNAGWSADGAGPMTGHWRWFSAAYRHGVELAQVECALDLQGCVLLRLRTVAGLGLWVFLEQRSAPEQWVAVRRALKAHPGSGR